MKVLIILVVLNSFSLQNTEVNYESNINEQIINYKVNRLDNVEKDMNAFVFIIKKYIISQNIEFMTDNDWVSFFRISNKT